MNIQEQLEAFDHARVVVVLKPRSIKRQGRSSADVVDHDEIALESTIPMQEDSFRRIEQCFQQFEGSRRSQLARAMSRDRSGLESVPAPPERARLYKNLGVVIGTVDRGGLRDLQTMGAEVEEILSPPELSLIAPVEESALAGAPTGNSWGVDLLGIQKLWDKGHTGAGMLIGHLDTGVDSAHPALTGAISHFVEFDRMGEEVAGAVQRDTRKHGTHTAGLLVGREHAGLRFGVAPGAKLASAVVIEGGDVSARVIAGLDWVVGLGCRIVNLSLGIRGFDPQFATILRLLRQRGVLPIAAVGNEGPLTSRSPGNHVEVVSVGAFDEAGYVWIDSSSQTLPSKRTVPDLVAPGAPVWSSIPGGGLMGLSGTSMAAPHIAGLAAILLAAKPDRTIAQVEQAIYDSCKWPQAADVPRGNRGIPSGPDALARL